MHQSIRLTQNYSFNIIRIMYTSCAQAALRTLLFICPSVCPSVRLSVCHTFFTMSPSSYHHDVFSSYYHWQKWCPCNRSRSEVKGQIIEVKINFAPIWAFPYCNCSLNSHMAMKSCTHGYGIMQWYSALLFFKVIRQITRSHRTKNRRFWPELGVSVL